MKTSRGGAAGAVALVIGHCAGMVDLVALPVWIGIVLLDLEVESAGKPA